MHTVFSSEPTAQLVKCGRGVSPPTERGFEEEVVNWTETEDKIDREHKSEASVFAISDYSYIS